MADNLHGRKRKPNVSTTTVEEAEDIICGSELLVQRGPMLYVCMYGDYLQLPCFAGRMSTVRAAAALLLGLGNCSSLASCSVSGKMMMIKGNRKQPR